MLKICNSYAAKPVSRIPVPRRKPKNVRLYVKVTQERYVPEKRNSKLGVKLVSDKKAPMDPNIRKLGKKILVKGDPGIGKTTLFKENRLGLGDQKRLVNLSLFLLSF